METLTFWGFVREHTLLVFFLVMSIGYLFGATITMDDEDNDAKSRKRYRLISARQYLILVALSAIAYNTARIYILLKEFAG